jgi:hypothetical protein
MHRQNRKEKPVVQYHVAAFRRYVNQLGLPWPKRWRANFLDLGAALCVQRTLVVRSLARTLTGPQQAMRYADKRLRRFLGNERLDETAVDAALACHLRFLLARLPRHLQIPVMVDWTQVAEYDLLWLQIPCRGRSLPLVGFVVSGRGDLDEEAWRTRSEKEVLTRLRNCWPAEFGPPLLLMDRGFDKGPLLSWLLEEGWLFVLRAKENQFLDANGQVLNGALCGLPGLPRCFPKVTYTEKHRFPLHLVVSAVRHKRTGKNARWLLVTNLPEPQLRRAPGLYALRMSPEETHRDVKRGPHSSGLALDHLGRLRADRLERLVFLLSLVYSFLVLVGHTALETHDWLKQKRWGLSISTLGLELLRQAGPLASRLARRACAHTTLDPAWN